MLSNWWLTGISCVELSALSVALIVFARRPAMLSRWPSLFVNLAVEFATDMALMTWLSDPHRHREYFFTYWISVGVRAILRLWIIADIVRSFPGLDFLPRKLYLFVGVAGLTMAISSGFYCFHEYHQLTMQTKEWAVLLNQCVNVAWGTFAIAVLGAIKLLNFGWDPQGAGIACGVFIRICSNLLVGEMIASHYRPIRLAGNFLDTICSIVIFLLWSYLIVRPQIVYRDQIIKSTQTTDRSISALLSLSRERWKTIR